MVIKFVVTESIQNLVKHTAAKRIANPRGWFRAFLVGASISSGVLSDLPTTLAQQPRRQANRSDNLNANRPPKKETASDKAAKEVVNLYTDAANFQNAGAYPLAVDAWKKFIEKYPNDPLVSKAYHYLGVCYLQIEKPEYEQAIKSFHLALRDAKLEVREESLVNLGWCLFYTARELNEKTKADRYADAIRVLDEFLKNYPDGSYADKALFYTAECEYQLGKIDRAVSLYRQLVTNEKYSKSTVLPDALYALGVGYEELKQPKLATEAYDRFLKEFTDHRLAREVRLRKAEFLLSEGNAKEAVQMLSVLIDDQDAPMRDYLLYRYGYALAKAGEFEKSSEIYQRLAKEFPDSKYSTDSELAAGQALMREQRYDDAKAFFQKLLGRKDVLAAQAAHWLAQIASIQKNPTEVIQIARDALSWAPDSEWRVALQVDLADALMSQPDGLEEATALYEAVALEHEEHASAPRAAYNSAFNALRTGKPVDAGKWADFFAKRYKDDPLASEVAFIRAESLLQAGKQADAAAAFEQLIVAYPDAANVNLWKMRAAAAYFFAENFQQAVPALKKIIAENKDPNTQGEALFLLGASHFKQTQYPEAIEHLSQSIAIEPAWPGVDEAYLVLSEAYAKSGDNEKAKSTLKQLLEKFPNSPFKTQAEFRLGQLSADARDFDTALAAYEHVINAKDAADLREYAQYGKAWVLVQLSKFDQALDLAIDVSTKTHDANLQQEATLAAAICLRELGKPQETIAIIEKLLGTSDSLDKEVEPKLLFEQALAYTAANDLKKSNEVLTKLQDRYADFPDVDKAIYENAWAMRDSGQENEAIGLFKRLAEQFPDSPLAAEAYYHVAQGDYDQQKFESALKAYTIAMTKTNDHYVREKSLYKLGWTHYQQQNWQEASSFFKKLAAEFPEGELAIDSVFMQGECALKLREYKDAVNLYKRAADGIKKANSGVVDAQVTSLVYLHGAQAAREIKDWDNCIAFSDNLEGTAPDSPYLPLAKFEKAFGLQNQRKFTEAITVYESISESNRNEIGARSRFMIGEIYFGNREFAKAIQEYQKVMFGYGATQAPDDIKNWQARSAVEAGRCADLLIGDLTGEARSKAIGLASDMYQFVVANHPAHELVGQAKNRVEELKRAGK